MSTQPKILLFDIETAPNLAWVWGKYEQDVIEFEREWYILCYAYKWLGEKRTYTVGLPEFKTYKKDREDDKELVTSLWKLFDEADVIIAHNGNSFDIKKANARFLEHGLCPPSSYQQIDTKLVAKRYFKFDSNKLDDLGRHLKAGQKLSTGGFALWKGCMNGDIKAWQKMLKYNKQDVVLLEEVYLKLRGWMTNHPNLNVLKKTVFNCPICGSVNVNKQGTRATKTGLMQRFHCRDCGGWCQGKTEGVKGVLR